MFVKIAYTKTRIVVMSATLQGELFAYNLSDVAAASEFEGPESCAIFDLLSSNAGLQLMSETNAQTRSTAIEVSQSPIFAAGPAWFDRDF